MHGSWHSPLRAIPAFTGRRTTLLLAVGLAQLRKVGPQGLPLVLPDWKQALVTMATLLVYVPFVTGLFIVNLGWFRAHDSHRLQALLVKAATACLFLRKSSARYWTTFAPLAAWSAALLWQAAAERRAMVADEHATRNLPGIFDQLQIAYAALFSSAIILIVAQ